MTKHGTATARTLATAALLLIATSSLSRETITFRFEGEVTSVSGQFAASGVTAGDRISGTYTFDPNVPARFPPPPPILDWNNAVLGWTLSVGSATAGGSGGTPFADFETFPSVWQVILRSSAGAPLLGDELLNVVLSWDRQVGFGPNWTLPRTPGFRFPGTIGVSARNSGLQATLTRLTYFGADSEFPASPAVWRAKPIPEQVPGGNSIHQGAKLNASLWFNDGQQFATLSLTDRFNQASTPRLYCGLAGEPGELIWQAVSIPAGAEKRWQIRREDLLPVTDCDSVITTVAGLRNAAAQRLVYVEFERGGSTHRGQLWPKSLMADRVHIASGTAAAGQVVESEVSRGASRINTRLRLNERDRLLDSIDYFIDGANAAQRLVSAALHCAPAGVEGPAVAELETAIRSTRWIKLTAASLQPRSSTSPCGVEINTVASLVEAYLQGNLYFRMEAADGQVWRGQLPRP